MGTGDSGVRGAATGRGGGGGDGGELDPAGAADAADWVGGFRGGCCQRRAQLRRHQQGGVEDPAAADFSHANVCVAAFPAGGLALEGVEEHGLPCAAAPRERRVEAVVLEHPPSCRAWTRGLGAAVLALATAFIAALPPEESAQQRHERRHAGACDAEADLDLVVDVQPRHVPVLVVVGGSHGDDHHARYADDDGGTPHAERRDDGHLFPVADGLELQQLWQRHGPDEDVEKEPDAAGKVPQGFEIRADADLELGLGAAVDDVGGDGKYAKDDDDAHEDKGGEAEVGDEAGVE